MPVDTSHSSPKTKGTYCDGKPCFEVLVRRKKYCDEETYWCGNMHGYFDPFNCKCPREGKRFKYERPKFNGWKIL